jgi:hypothetical protein
MAKMLPFLRIVQRRAARVAITASATRGQGAGIVVCARHFCGRLKLTRFATSDQRAFGRELNAATNQLMACLPKRSASWGLARKLANIFLRDSFYTSYLTRAYKLAKAENFFEIPLDSITAKRIRDEVPHLPPLDSVKHLDRAMSNAYQAAALTIARQHGIARVHLDAYWWGARD